MATACIARLIGDDPSNEWTARWKPLHRACEDGDARVQIFYTDTFVLPLPPAHRFPMEKYSLLRRRVEEARLGDVLLPAAATDTQLRHAHDENYLARVRHGTLSPMEVRRIGFPWSPELVERSRRSCGATIAAGRAALENGVAVNLAGGTHHAFPHRGEGYCVFNDSVVAIRTLRAEGRVGRAIVIDCDVHQGNGTAVAAAADASLFTFSIHGAKNFPLRKERSDLDVALPDRTGDSTYLAALEDGLAKSLEAARPELAIYLAGADPYEDDRLGRLALTIAGLAERDRLVLEFCHRLGVPVTITMAGGYARRTDDTVSIHFQTVCRAAIEAGSEPLRPAPAQAS